uniref:DUF6273 domain-containing protein n=1 Tax=Eubacterium cellulosolvens TaxID=29322 RepID=UPI00048370AB|nr:DUF6273 domain-containing protein [[Eubacterium] cellulosolvens]
MKYTNSCVDIYMCMNYNIYKINNLIINDNGNLMNGRGAGLLSELWKAQDYFSSADGTCCKPTAYALEQGACEYKWNAKEYEKYIGNCYWWLRSAQSAIDFSGHVYSVGGTLESGSGVNLEDLCVRPAIWIDLES